MRESRVHCSRPYGPYSPCNSLGQNTGVGSLSLLQGIFPNQGSNAGLLHCRRILYQLSHKGSPRILEWVAYPFSSRSSQPRNPTRVSCIAGGFFTNWAIRKVLLRRRNWNKSPPALPLDILYPSRMPLPAAPINLRPPVDTAYSRGEWQQGNLGPYQHQWATDSTLTPLDDVFSYYLCQSGSAFSLPCCWKHPFGTSSLSCIG